MVLGRIKYIAAVQKRVNNPDPSPSQRRLSGEVEKKGKDSNFLLIVALSKYAVEKVGDKKEEGILEELPTKLKVRETVGDSDETFLLGLELVMRAISVGTGLESTLGPENSVAVGVREQVGDQVKEIER